MSRVIVKNIPKIFTEKDIVEHFRSMDEITDCKIIKDQSGVSRKFAFVGFKRRQTAVEVRQKYNRTYLGVSKILVEIAHLKDEERERSRDSSKDLVGKHKITITDVSHHKDKVSKLEHHKQKVEQGMRNSWSSVLCPQYPTFDEQNVEQLNIPKEEDRSRQKKGRGVSQTKIIKAPIISDKNKKYVQKPLEIDSRRLFVKNLPYNLQQEEIRSQFSRFGTVIEVKLPRVAETTSNKGFAFVTYQKPEQALRALSDLDNTVVFGRIIHIQSSLEDIGGIIKQGKQSDYQKKIIEQFGQKLEEKSSYKKRKKRQMRDKLNDTTSWNTLFLNPNTVLERMSKKLKITKSEILLADNLAAKMALAETEVIEETKTWMKTVGINIEFLEMDRNLCQRSTRILLLKNLNYRCTELELRELMQFYGMVVRLLISPNRAIGIVEFQNATYAENALKNLQNHKFKNNFLYLEYAPITMMTETEIQQQEVKVTQQIEEIEELSKVIYIKNLNFVTEQAGLREILLKAGSLKYVKIIKTKEGKSQGYAFAEYEKQEHAIAAIKTLQNYLLDGHKIELSISKKKKSLNMDQLKKLKEKLAVEEIKSNKLSVKNIAFQATKQQLKELFEEHGSVNRIRVPKKMDGSHRGFAFVEYNSMEEAAFAKEILSHSHLYGRKLVIEYEKGDRQ